ncbi:TPA: hypothetical protein ACW7OZ_002282, partial [Neisseria meningitidis]
VDVFSNHGLGGLPEEGAHEKSPKCLGGNLGDFGEFCKGLGLLNGDYLMPLKVVRYLRSELINQVVVVA